MKKKFIVLTVTLCLLLVCIVGATMAYFIASTGEVENTFTIGNVQITLTESTGSDYLMTPGVALEKDPTVTVKAGSDDCWLFVKIEKSSDFDTYMTYLPEDGWFSLAGVDGVYYRQVVSSSGDSVCPVLRNNHVTVKDTVTKQQLKAVSTNPTLSFTAYAIQQTGFSTAELAWNELNG